MSTETQKVDVQTKLEGDHAKEEKTQVYDCVGMMMLEQEGLQHKKNKLSRTHQVSRTSCRSRRQ